METTPQDYSASFERLKACLEESAPSVQKEKTANPLPRRRRLASEDTQPVEEPSDGESDDAIVPTKARISSPATSLLTAGGLDLEDTQFSTTRKPEFENTGDSQLPHTLLTDTNVDTTHNIHLDYSPEKLTHPYGDDETQKDPDSYNDRMKDNIDSMAEVSRNIEREDSDRMLYSQSQHPEPIYFDERRRFGDVGLLVKEQGDGSDEEDEIIRPAIENDSLPIGLTQMFEASSPQRPATRSSIMPTSPRLDMSSPAAPREPITNPPRSSGAVSHYISVEESQAERERRRKKLALPEDTEDRDFGPKPPELVSRLRNRIREKDSVEQFKEISVARPKPQGRVPGRRGRPPKNRIVEPLLTSGADTDRISSPMRTEPILVDDEEDEAIEEEDESGDEAELEVPGTMEPVVTEVKKTQSSQHHTGSLLDPNTGEIAISSDLEAIADSQPETTAKVAAELRYGEDILRSVQTRAVEDARQKALTATEPSSPAHPSTQDPLSSSPPLLRTSRREALVIKSSPYPQVQDSNEPDAVGEENDETPRTTRSKNQGSAKGALLETMKTPMTAKKIPFRIPNTIPATSPYNRDNVITNLETPVPTTKRKRNEESDLTSSVEIVPTSVPPKDLSKDAQQNIASDLRFPRPKRSRPNNLRRSSGTTDNAPKNHENLLDSPVRVEEASVDQGGSPMNLSPEASRAGSSSPPLSPKRPTLNLDTRTPQKATIPFRPSSSQRREFTASGPVRVFAQWENLFYPALVHELPNLNESTPTRFVGGEISVRLNRIKRLHLSPGDMVKIHGQRQKVWIVQNVYKSSATLNERTKTESQLEREEVLDVHGNDMVKLKHKASSELLDTNIGNIILTAAQFNQLKVKTIDVEHSLQSMENTPLFKKEDSILETPSKFSRRSTPSVTSNGQKLKPLKFPPSTKGKQGIFAGMRFTISLPADSEGQEKASLTAMLQRYGAYILEQGFEEIFETIDGDTTDLVPRQGVDEIGFTAVISDRASTTSKYLQALALGIPCLAVKWVEDSVTTGMPLPWQDYLLPAGESQYLDGAVKSRVIDWVDIKSASFVTMFSRRKRLMDAMNVIFHDGSGKRKNDVQPFAFLIHAMGPAHVQYTKSVEGVNDLLKVKNSKTHWHFVFSKEDKARFSVKRKGRDPAPVRIVGDEWLKQSVNNSGTQGPAPSVDQDAYFSTNFADSLKNQAWNTGVYSNPQNNDEASKDDVWQMILHADPHALVDAYDHVTNNPNPFQFGNQKPSLFNSEDYARLAEMVHDIKNPTPEQELSNYLNFMVNMYNQNPSAFPELQRLEQQAAEEQYQQTVQEQMRQMIWDEVRGVSTTQNSGMEFAGKAAPILITSLGVALVSIAGNFVVNKATFATRSEFRSIASDVRDIKALIMAILGCPRPRQQKALI
ncbi:hypothetical protein H072_6352 [Dactylellina haptotyla CBS 200.50]|uniref:BRCT domain-containing protein n=1 Tax=Dactylellina haptotyla (strain CBS 200.50) TaxID=1284197 RepID=S8AA70_DACHA|nr:hypothetical protein H072_6352 [Dactylellina haptotyla CBS 200.50]